MQTGRIGKVTSDPLEHLRQLRLKEHGLKSAVIMCVGMRSEEDNLADMAKVRKAKEDFYIFKG